jgi:hypothetical protein
MILSGISMLTKKFQQIPSFKSFKGRKNIHYSLSIIIALPFLWIVSTGSLFRTLRVWSNIDKENLYFLLDLHQFKIFGLENYLPIIFGLLVLGSSLFGVTLNSFISKYFNSRELLLGE